jgi:hypothetical protein
VPPQRRASGNRGSRLKELDFVVLAKEGEIKFPVRTCMIVIPAKAGIYSPAARQAQGGKTGETEYRITDLQQGRSRPSRLSGNPADSKFVAPAKAGAQGQVTEILDSRFRGNDD